MKVSIHTSISDKDLRAFMRTTIEEAARSKHLPVQEVVVCHDANVRTGSFRLTCSDLLAREDAGGVERTLCTEIKRILDILRPAKSRTRISSTRTH